MTYDMTVIGSGPGGYVAAIRCAQLGMKTAIVERYAALGGTCLNVGCIPSKALLDSTELYHNAVEHFKTHGIEATGLKLNWPQLLARKEKVLKDSVAGIAYLMKKHKIDVYEGHGTFLTPTSISVAKRDGSAHVLATSKTIIATGSKPVSLPFAPLDKKRLISSTEALSLSEIPGELVIIGAGVIGVELGSVFARVGTKVHIVELLDAVIPNMDRTMGKELQRSLTKLGVKFYLGHKVVKASAEKKGVRVDVTDPDGQALQLKADYGLVAVGRRPYTDNLGLAAIGVVMERGFVRVNERLETNVPGVFAIGDVIGGKMLAHKAEEEGIFVAEQADGQKPHLNYSTIPDVVYTWPEVASVGATEEELRTAGRDYKSGSFSFKALGRARAANESDGLIKVLADNRTDELLGVHMFGARAADMIAEAVVALEFRASAEDIARTSHAHPTFTEAIREACLAATGNRAIHA
ncbi:dihydrolipoyl dehydrogenase [candidate division KSB1 bacterium]|nr:dihydrolipoyl dehydrogenase [candidate division KSB1 bacterium]